MPDTIVGLMEEKEGGRARYVRQTTHARQSYNTEWGLWRAKTTYCATIASPLVGFRLDGGAGLTTATQQQQNIT